MWVVPNYVGCLSALWPSDLKEIAGPSGDALRDLLHDHCARYLAHVKAEACALLGDKRGLRETWDQYRSYFDCQENSNEWFEDRRRSLLTDIPMLVRYLEQNRLGLYRKKVWALRWRHISRLFGRRTRFGNFMSIPWWAWWILIWILIQLFRNQ
jgi:hypothetical protein